MRYTDILNESPIRTIVDKTETIPIFECMEEHAKGVQKTMDVRYRLSDILQILQKNQEEAQNEQLRVTVVGEVKAGKSTFINALLARKVAYTDMSEATAAVSEISYASEEYFKICYKDGSEEAFDEEYELVEHMEEKADEKAYWNTVDKIKIGIDNEDIDGIVLVDTPGLLTITTQNKELTSAYIYESDILLWVLDSQDLGSSIVAQELEEKMKFGKKMIGIINKIDTEEERRDLKEYIEVHYARYFDEMYLISGRNAWIAQIEEDDDLWEVSHLEDVLNYIGYLRRNKGKIKNQSILNSVFVQLSREKNLHEYMLKNIVERKELYDRDKESLKRLQTDVKKSIHEELQYWLHQIFLKKECQKLLDCSMTEYESLFYEYSNPSHMEQVINEIYHRLANMIASEWTQVKEALSTTKLDSMVTLDFQVERSKWEQEEQPKALIDGTTVKASVATAVAIAGYAAWIGPVASTVTFVGALSSFVPPLAILGLAAGSYVAYQKSNGNVAINAQKRKQEVEDFYRQAYTYITEQQMTMMERELIKYSELFYQHQLEQMKQMIQSFHMNYEGSEYEQFEKDTKFYILMLENKLLEIKKELDNRIIWNEVD